MRQERDFDICCPYFAFSFGFKGEDRLGGRDVPSHAGSFQPVLQDYFIAAFNSPAPDKIALFLIFRIVDVVNIVCDIPKEVDGAAARRAKIPEFVQHLPVAPAP